MMEMADLALIHVFSLYFAVLLQWDALEEFFRFLIGLSPVQSHARKPHSGLSPKRGIVQPVPGKP